MLYDHDHDIDGYSFLDASSHLFKMVLPSVTPLRFTVF